MKNNKIIIKTFPILTLIIFLEIFNLISNNNINIINASENKIYYVNKNIGDDNNTGTSTSTPWKTLQYSFDQLEKGDTLEIMSGTYFPESKLDINNSGEINNYITIKNYKDDQVIIDGNNINTSGSLIKIEEESYIQIQNIEFTGFNGNWKLLLEIRNNSQYININNCKFRDTRSLSDENEGYGGTHAIYVSSNNGGGNINISNNQFTNLLGQDPEIPAYATAIKIIGTGDDESNKISNITIYNNTLNNIAPANSEAITVSGNVDNFLISENNIIDSNNIGIDIAGNYQNSPNPNFDQPRNGIVKNNYIKRSNSISEGGYAAGIYLDGSKDILIENNKITQCDVGISINAEENGISDNIILKNNIIYYNYKSGIRFGSNDNTNRIIKNCKIINNTAINNDTLNKGFGQLWVEIANNCLVKNNIFYSSIDARLLNSWEINTDNNNIIDYNLWFYDQSIIHTKKPFVWSGNTYENFNSYQEETEFDQNSIYIEDPNITIFK